MEEIIKLDLETKKTILIALQDKLDSSTHLENISFSDVLKEYGDFYYEKYDKFDAEGYVEGYGKYQNGGIVIQIYKDNLATDMFVRQTWERSDVADYDYTYDDVELVEPYSETIVVKKYREI